MSGIPPLPAEKRTALEAAVKGLGKKPTVKEAAQLAAQLGVSASSVRRAYEKAHPAQPEKPQPAGDGPLKESVSPAIKGNGSKPAEAEGDRGPFACGACGAAWTLEPGEAQLNCCPGCQEPFA